MPKKKIILLVVIILILIGVGFGYRQYRAQNLQNFQKSLREEVLNFLEENLEFCQIVKENISFNNGEFWLICNSRPFYAVYEKGKLNYELNGWRFLKEQPDILDELESNDCKFYTVTPDNTLIFSCREGKARRYSFSPSDFKLIKIDETLFINLFLESPWYDFEKLTAVSNFGLNEEDLLRIEMESGGRNVKFFFNLDKLYFSLPTIVDEKLSLKEKASLSFQLIGLCKQDNIVEELGSNRAFLIMDCKAGGRPMISYNFDFCLSNFLFPEAEFEAIFPYFARYNFPFSEVSKLKYLQSKEDEINKYSYYLFGGRVLIAQSSKNSGIISEVYFKAENLQ